MADIKALAESVMLNEPQKQRLSARRTRVFLESTCILDNSKGTLLVEENRSALSYYYREDSLAKSAKKTALHAGEGYVIYNIALLARGTQTRFQDLAANAIAFFKGPLTGYMRLDFDSFMWLEEDDKIFTPPTDPHIGIETRRSLRRIEIHLDGEMLADSGFSEHLFESNLPSRYYLPWGSVNWQYFNPSSTTTVCPHKGSANYFDALVNGKVYKNLVWYYKDSSSKCPRISGMVCFDNSKVKVLLDGEDA